MSTLCAYENYLRDRYVLGQSVHYAAGSNSPKPKSYDREGNEYTWSDEAGDYVRQVGGPGGGRTIRLSEVEKAEIEQPQNGSAQAVVATDNDKFYIKPAQFKSSRWFGDKNRTYRVPIDVSRIDSRGKQAIVDTSLNAAVSELSLIGLRGGDVWHTPRFEFERNIYNTLSRNEELRNVLLKKLDTLIDKAVKHNEPKTTVGDASIALTARGLKDIFEKIDQYVPGDYSRRMWPGYDSALKKALSFNGESFDIKPLKTDGGRYFSVAESSIADPFYASFESAEIDPSKKDDNPAPQTEQVDAGSVQHDSEKEATSQNNVDYSEFADAYKRYRTEGKKVASLKRKASKIQKAVLNPSLSATPEEIKSAKESLAKIRDEISASEQVQRSLTPELAKFVDGNRVVFIDNGDSFVINPSSELVQALGLRIELLDSLKKTQKASKEAKKRGLNGHAGELDSVAHKVEDEIARVNNLLSQMFPNETVVSTVDEKPKRRPTNKKPEESNAQFDASGLGLPGKSDVALKPDVAENKDAPYFIRRDLEATPKSETEERVEEVDEVSEVPSSEAPQRDDDATLERKAKEALGKGEPLRKKATRLRSKAKDAALKGRKEEAAGLRKQADEIEAEARKYIDEATNAGVELKNRRAEASQQPAPETKEPIENPEVPNSSAPEQQPEPIAEPAQEQPAKPRPERWTPLKSKMNDDDRRVIENTRKRLNYGLSELAWRLGNAKEKGDVQRVKQLVATAANHYLEQARRAYRSHGGTEALAAFDEALGGDGLTVGQLRDRVVDKFRKIALMEANDLFKFAGERLDEFESFAEADSEPISNKEIYLNSIRDKNGKWEDLDDKDNEIAVEDGKPATLFPDEYFGRRMGSERGLADAVRRALKSMTRKGEYRDSFENGAEYADPKHNIDTPTRMGRFLSHGYKDSLDGMPVSRDDYSEQRYQELLEKFPTDRESRKLNDFFKSNNREVNKLIKENEDEYKQSKNKSEVVQRVVDGIRDLLSGGRQNGSAEAPPSESLRDGTTGEVLEAGGADRPSDGGDGRDFASATPTLTPGDKTFNDTLGRIYDLAKSYSPSLGRMVARRVLEKKRHKKADLTTAIDVEYTEKTPRDIEQKFQAYKEACESLDRVKNNVSVDAKTRKKARETCYKTRDAFLDSVDEYADSVIQRFQEQSLNRQNKSVSAVIAEEAKKSDIPESRVREKLDAPDSLKLPQEKEKPDWLVALESQEDLRPVSTGKYNPNAKPYSWKAKFPETEDELREYWREHVDGGEDEEVSFGSDGERISVGEQSGDAPMTPDELRRFAQLRHGRELRKSLGLSEHFSEKELKKLQESNEKRGRGRPTKTSSEATIRVAREAQKSEVPQKQIQERIAEALGTPTDTSKRKSSRRPKKL